MNADLEARILDLLNESPGSALPLREVHRVLTAEFGVHAGTLEQFRERLRSDTGPVLMVEPENPLEGAVDWPAGTRSEYETALREAGADFGPWLTVTAVDNLTAGDSPAAVVRASLLELYQTAGRRPGIRAAIRTALAELRAPRGTPSPDRSTGEYVVAGSGRAPFGAVGALNPDPVPGG